MKGASCDSHERYFSEAMLEMVEESISFRERGKVRIDNMLKDFAQGAK